MSYYELKWYPQSYVTEIPQNGIVRIIRDYWWLIDADRNVAFYNGSPQCNHHEELAKRYLKGGTVKGAVAVEQIPIAFVKINISDYCN